jgi:hypothetical protein
MDTEGISLRQKTAVSTFPAVRPSPVVTAPTNATAAEGYAMREHPFLSWSGVSIPGWTSMKWPVRSCWQYNMVGRLVGPRRGGGGGGCLQPVSGSGGHRFISVVAATCSLYHGPLGWVTRPSAFLHSRSKCLAGHRDYPPQNARMLHLPQSFGIMKIAKQSGR